MAAAIANEDSRVPIPTANTVHLPPHSPYNGQPTFFIHARGEKGKLMDRTDNDSCGLVPPPFTRQIRGRRFWISDTPRRRIIYSLPSLHPFPLSNAHMYRMSAAIAAPMSTSTPAPAVPVNNGNATATTANHPLAPFHVQLARREDLDEICDFLFTDFLTNEPLNASLQLAKEECANFFRDLVESSLHDGISYVVRDPREGGRLVATRLGFISRRQQENGGGGGESFGKERPENGKVRKICAILHAVESKIWQLVPAHIDCLASWLILSVNSQYKRRGIAAALSEHGLDTLVALGCQGIAVECSALNSQNLFRKLGYVRLYELSHSDWKDADGHQVFKCSDGTDRITLEFKAFPEESNGVQSKEKVLKSQ